MTEVGMHEAKTRLSQLVELALAGEEVVITRRGEPVARLEPVRAVPLRLSDLRGIYKGQGWIADDFDDELPEEYLGLD